MIRPKPEDDDYELWLRLAKIEAMLDELYSCLRFLFMNPELVKRYRTFSSFHASKDYQRFQRYYRSKKEN